MTLDRILALALAFAALMAFVGLPVFILPAVEARKARRMYREELADYRPEIGGGAR